MCILQATFGNPRRLISDRGAAFISEEFKKYCEDSKLQMAHNCSWQRSIEMTPLKLIFGVEMKHPDLLPLCDLIKEESAKMFLDEREAECQKAE